MLKGTTFSGQQVFAQLTGMINRSTFSSLVAEHGADYYSKRCKSWEHLICMLCCIINNCASLREITHGIAAYGDKLNHLRVNYTRPRSTLGDENVTRSEKFFGALYNKNNSCFSEGLSIYEDEKKRVFQFLTNILDMTAEEIELLYKLRWQIGDKNNR